MKLDMKNAMKAKKMVAESKTHERGESAMKESGEPKMKGDPMKDGCVKCGMDKVK